MRQMFDSLVSHGTWRQHYLTRSFTASWCRMDKENDSVESKSRETRNDESDYRLDERNDRKHDSPSSSVALLAGDGVCPAPETAVSFHFQIHEQARGRED